MHICPARRKPDAAQRGRARQVRVLADDRREMLPEFERDGAETDALAKPQADVGSAR